MLNKIKELTNNLPPLKMLCACIGVLGFFWLSSSTRHVLLQSNAYDLGLFDQWIWLASQGLPPYSSMEGVHLLADHGAWMLYFAAIAYKFHANIQWLFATQAAGLSFAAIPIWFLGRQAGLSEKLCWLVCALWWLQPVVFNTNLFDFHPEVWAMPALAGCYWASRENRPWTWFLLLIVLLGCRDGLILVVGGIGLEQLLRRRFIWSFAAIGLACAWLAFLNRWLYPMLTGNDQGPKAVAGLFSYLGSNLDEVLLTLITKPTLIFNEVNWLEGLIYILLISSTAALFWRRRSVYTLVGIAPLLITNILSEASPQRTLIHHYSLPIALIVVVAAIDGIAIEPRQCVPWKKLVWTAVFWAILAKPWFFAGPYLQRIQSIPFTQKAILTISKDARVLTTSYLAPHMTQRSVINFPRTNANLIELEKWDVLLLNPEDPGWASDRKIQETFLERAKNLGWSCDRNSTGLELCMRTNFLGDG